ncbi:MAG: DUF3276 family protein [Paludibacter sp.]|jgi:hypothetical protein|nr:DUF3276 family protein [Paludibacter sp.]
MESEKRKVDFEKRDNEIVYSRSIKAGKRIYYLDVKKSRNDDLFLAITESKKKVSTTDQDATVTYEKHKIFLYKEDFSKFMEGMEEVIGFIRKEQGDAPQRNVTESEKPHNQPNEDTTPEIKKGFFNKFKF